MAKKKTEAVDEFRVPGSDKNGHYENIWVKVQPALAHEYENILAGKAFSYRSKQEIIRHAMMRHIPYLKGVDKTGFKSIYSQMEANNVLLRAEEIRAEIHNQNKQLAKQVNRYLEDGDEGLAKSVVARFRDNILAMEDDDHWKTVYLRKLDKQFGHLIQGQALNFLDMSDEDEF